MPATYRRPQHGRAVVSPTAKGSEGNAEDDDRGRLPNSAGIGQRRPHKQGTKPFTTAFQTTPTKTRTPAPPAQFRAEQQPVPQVEYLELDNHRRPPGTQAVSMRISPTLQFYTGALTIAKQVWDFRDRVVNQYLRKHGSLRHQPNKAALGRDFPLAFAKDGTMGWDCIFLRFFRDTRLFEPATWTALTETTSRAHARLQTYDGWRVVAWVPNTVAAFGAATAAGAVGLPQVPAIFPQSRESAPMQIVSNSGKRTVSNAIGSTEDQQGSHKRPHLDILTEALKTGTKNADAQRMKAYEGRQENRTTQPFTFGDLHGAPPDLMQGVEYAQTAIPGVPRVKKTLVIDLCEGDDEQGQGAITPSKSSAGSLHMSSASPALPMVGQAKKSLVIDLFDDDFDGDEEEPATTPAEPISPKLKDTPKSLVIDLSDDEEEGSSVPRPAAPELQVTNTNFAIVISDDEDDVHTPSTTIPHSWATSSTTRGAQTQSHAATSRPQQPRPMASAYHSASARVSTPARPLATLNSSNSPKSRTKLNCPVAGCPLDFPTVQGRNSHVRFGHPEVGLQALGPGEVATWFALHENQPDSSKGRK